VPRSVEKPQFLSLSACLISGLAYGCAFPTYNLGFLAWIALVPFLWSLSLPTRRPALHAFRNGFLTLFFANLLIFSWLGPTFATAHINAATTLLCWTALAAVLALYGGGFAVYYRALPERWWRPWLGAAAWVALDEVRTVALTGFPWTLMSLTQARYPAVVQIASVTGAVGVTFLLVLLNASIADALTTGFGHRASALRTAAISLIAVLGTIVAGQVRLARAPEMSDRTLRAGLLQGNIDQYRKWDDAYEADIRQTYATLVQNTRDNGPLDVMIWPETAVPGWVPKDPFYTQWVAGLAKRSGTPQLFGSLSAGPTGEYNAAILMDSSGTITGQYDKTHLVPFGEYIPFGGFLKSVVPYLGQVGTFDRGRRVAPFDLNGVRIAPNICYEAIFPALVRDSARDADVIVNVTNDGWFLKTAAPEQHFLSNVYRAVENGRPVVRAANTGISASIDAYGRIRFESSLLSTGAYSVTVNLPPRDFVTFFSRWGNWFGWLCLLVFLASLGSRFGLGSPNAVAGGAPDESTLTPS
jgi:apolipoprotein N-acyltransferase